VLGQRALKITLAALVIAAVGRQVVRVWGEFSRRGDRLDLDSGWLIAAVLLYVAGLVPFGYFYARVVASSPTPIPTGPAVRAYLLSHLGKYVPGKALVVVMRAGLSAVHGARAATAAFATLYETLVMMAVGGWIAALGFAMSPARTVQIPLGSWGTLPAPLPWLGAAAGLGFSVLVVSQVFTRLVRLVSLPFPNVGPDALPGLSGRLLMLGLMWATLGWILLGLSQVAVLRGMGLATLPPSSIPAVIAAVALATVAGFAVPISPGGLGVREWVLWTSLGALIDRDRAVLAALGLRLVWLVGELVAAAVLLPWPMRGKIGPAATAAAEVSPPPTNPTPSRGP
jgi:uncharacterized membrane protein YbhN (UPF0104 family)